MPEETLKRMESQAKLLVWVTVGAVIFLMVVALFMMGLTMWNTYRLGEQAADLRAVAVETHDSLCALYNKEVQSNLDAEALLKESPKGLLDEDGDVVIAADLLQRGIDQRKETIDALRTAGLDCDGEVIT